MFTTFQTALSALNATSTAIDVTGNNLANLNTVGFKDSNVSFLDLVTQSFGTVGKAQPGAGTQQMTIRSSSQGATHNTSGPLDAAVQGAGFFVMRTANNGQLLTRAGNFHTDANGYLTSLTGERVQGWTQLNANGTVNTSGPIGDIQVPSGSLQQPVATTNFALSMNLNASATVGAASGTFSNPMQVIDSLGNTQNLTVTVTKTGPNAWGYTVTIPSSALSTPSATPLATGTLAFNTDGTLKTPAATPPALTNQVAVKVTGLADGAADMTMNWNLNDPAGNPTLTQVDSPSTVSANSQDGTAPAQLTGVSIGAQGMIEAQFSNGLQKPVAQLALASIGNPDSLSAVGNNNFETSSQTTLPVIGTALTGGRGDILGGSLESSTVDIAKEFTNLIIYQRGYQADAKVINTEDQLTQDTISLKQ
jgi:flagellar hook protein FlgE